MKKWMTLGLALALTCGLGQNAMAQDTGRGPGFVDENGDGIHDFARRRGPRGVLNRQRMDFHAQLSAEQQAALTALIEELKASEASREDIRAAVHARFAEWGIERPEAPIGPHAGMRGSLLTQDQRVELHALMAELRAAQASREAMHAAVQARLAEWGIERPDVPAGPKMHRGPRGPRR